MAVTVKRKIHLRHRPNNPGLQATFNSPPPGDINQPYSSSPFSAVAGIAPYTFTCGGRPTGVSINSATGALSGTPTVSGSFPLTPQVTDSTSPTPVTVSGSVTLVINPAVVGGLSALDPDNSAHVEFLGAFRVQRSSTTAGGATTANGCPCTYRITAGGVFKLMMTLHGGPGGFAAGDLVEYDLPATGHYKPVSGSDYMPATQLAISGRWTDWDKVRETTGWRAAPGGTFIGGICLVPDPADPTNPDLGILWYTAYGYYSSKNWPVLGATRIRFSDHAVLDKYGPWWYVDNTVGATDKLRWKEVWQAIGVVPAYAQPSLNGHKMWMGGMVGSVAGSGHLGPGIQTFPDFPSLSDPPNSVLAEGRMLADYTARGAIAAFGPNGDSVRGCRRQDRYSNDTRCIMLGGGGDGIGVRNAWQMSMDMVTARVWAHTSALHGLWLWGCEVGDPAYDPDTNPTALTHVRYGDNPAIEDGSIEPLEPAYLGQGNGQVGGQFKEDKAHLFVLVPTDGKWFDPTKAIPEHSHGYAGTLFRAALRMMDVQHFFEVAAGTRRATQDGMRPWKQIDWDVKWGIPWCHNGQNPLVKAEGPTGNVYTFAQSERPVLSSGSACQSGVFDPTVRAVNDQGRIITVHGASVNPSGGVYDPLILVHRVKL